MNIIPGGPDSPVACPFCGNALAEGRFHSCREMREDPPQVVDFDWYWAPRVADWLVIAIAFVVLVFLGAHWLVSVGVPCPS